MYKFPLESLREYRKRKEEIYQKELSVCAHELYHEIEKLTNLTNRMQGAIKQVRKIKKDRFGPNENILYDNYLKSLKNKIVGQNLKVKQKENKKIEKTNELLNAVKKRKIVEKLKEYRLAEYLKEKQRKNQILSDEAGIMRYAKK